MAESARSFKNWFGNTIRIPQRTVGTVGLLGADAIKTTVGVVEDFGDIANHYTDEIVNLFSKDKKWYQKALNVPVAIGKTLVGAVEAAVKPVVNGVVNTGKTALNLTTNAWKSTFGSLFSAKPVSDISFNTIKTKKKGIIHIDTDKRTLDPNKTWTSNRGTRSKAAKKAATGAAVGGAVVAPAALAAAENKAKQMQGEMEKMQGKMEEMQKKMEEMQKNFNDKLTEVLDSNQQLEDKNQTLLKDNAQKDGEIAKLKAEIEGLKKNNEKKAEVKPEVKPEQKPEKKEEKPVEAKPEKKEEKKEDKSEGKEGKGADRLSEYVESDKGKSVVNYLAKNHPDMVVKFNSSKDTGHIHLGDASEELKIGTKNTEEVPTIILHEGAHALIHDDVEGIDDLIDYVDDLNERYGKQLFPISYNKKYDTLEKRRNEDVCELIALYARDDGSFEKHMKKLQSGKNEKLAQISDGDVEKLRDLCEDVISGLNTVKMYDYDEIPLRKRA